MIREIEALRIAENEILVLRFSEAISVEEVRLMGVALGDGPLKGRVVLIHAPEGEAIPTVVEK